MVIVEKQQEVLFSNKNLMLYSCGRLKLDFIPFEHKAQCEKRVLSTAHQYVAADSYILVTSFKGFCSRYPEIFQSLRCPLENI